MVTSGSASGAIPLDIGANTIQVVVTAEDGTKATYTITATRAGPSISIADAAGAEGGSVTFTVTKTGAGAVSLDWTASIGQPDTAAIADLGPTTSGTVAFTASDTTKTFSVATAQDAVDEDNETFTVTLSATSGMPIVTGRDGHRDHHRRRQVDRSPHRPNGLHRRWRRRDRFVVDRPIGYWKS